MKNLISILTIAMLLVVSSISAKTTKSVSSKSWGEKGFVQSVDQDTEKPAVYTEGWKDTTKATVKGYWEDNTTKGKEALPKIPLLIVLLVYLFAFSIVGVKEEHTMPLFAAIVALIMLTFAVSIFASFSFEASYILVMSLLILFLSSLLSFCWAKTRERKNMPALIIGTFFFSVGIFVVLFYAFNNIYSMLSVFFAQFLGILLGDHIARRRKKELDKKGSNMKIVNVITLLVLFTLPSLLPSQGFHNQDREYKISSNKTQYFVILMERTTYGNFPYEDSTCQTLTETVIKTGLIGEEASNHINPHILRSMVEGPGAYEINSKRRDRKHFFYTLEEKADTLIFDKEGKIYLAEGDWVTVKEGWKPNQEDLFYIGGIFALILVAIFLFVVTKLLFKKSSSKTTIIALLALFLSPMMLNAQVDKGNKEVQPGFYGVTAEDKTEAYIIQISVDTFELLNKEFEVVATHYDYSYDTITRTTFPKEYTKYLRKKDLGNEPVNLGVFSILGEDFKELFDSNDFSNWTYWLHGKKAFRKYIRLEKKYKK